MQVNERVREGGGGRVIVDLLLVCEFYNDAFEFQVAWIKSDSKAILAIHTLMVALNPRLSVTHNGHNTWKLHISHVQLNDSGSYMCQGM